MDVIYLEFAKAFDTVVHDILLRKVKALGIKGKVGSTASYITGNNLSV